MAVVVGADHKYLTMSFELGPLEHGMRKYALKRDIRLSHAVVTFPAGSNKELRCAIKVGARTGALVRQILPRQVVATAQWDYDYVSGGELVGATGELYLGGYLTGEDESHTVQIGHVFDGQEYLGVELWNTSAVDPHELTVKLYFVDATA